MKINTITSPSNSVLKRIRGLQERTTREKSGEFLLEGARPVEEAAARRLKLEKVVVSETFFQDGADLIEKLRLNELSIVDDRTFKELHSTASSCGIVGVAMIPTFVPRDIFDRRDPLIVVCDGIQDPGNLGTIVRSAYAAGAAGILLTCGSVDPYNPKVVRSAVGALFDMPVLHDLTSGQCLKLLADHCTTGWICDAAGDTLYCQADFCGPNAIILGNEARGVSREFLSSNFGSLTIPMRAGSESLNVGVSAGIILCEAYRQRQSLQSTKDQF